MKKRILIVSGETSGDQHGAALVEQVHRITPDVEFLGMGGEKMRQAGVDVRVDAGPLAVVGAIEVLRHIIPIYKAWHTLRHIIKRESPDLVVLIDYPTFNLNIAKLAKKTGIKVLYYISPQIWAWHKNRVQIIKERVDKMLVVFPFEESLYREKNVPVEYVGHPLAEKVHPDKEPHIMRHEWHIDSNARVIGLLPGSRKGEIHRLLPTMLAAAALLKKRYPDLVFILPLANSLSIADVSPYLAAGSVSVQIISGQFYNAMQLCVAAIVASGTATLETALLRVPMVIIYKMAAFTYYLAKRVVQIPHVGLCNIVAGEGVVKELIQEAASPEEISAEISRILEDVNYREEIQKKLLAVKKKLGQGGGVEKAARLLLELLEG